MPPLHAFLDRPIGVPTDAPVFDSVAQSRRMARRFAEAAQGTDAIIAVTAAFLASRWHRGLA